MTDQTTDVPNTDPDTAEDNEMKSLFGEASLRPQPSAELLARAKKAARPEWEAAVQRRKAETRTRRRFGTWAMAAAIALLAVMSVNQLVSGPVLDVQVVRTAGLSQNQVELQTGRITLREADELRTIGPAELQLSIGANKQVDLRLAPGTHARWHSAERLELLAGGIYVDTHGDARFGVDTSVGKIRDIGTRYVVSVNGETMEVAVSDGSIELQTPQGVTAAAPGSTSTSAVLRVANGSVSRTEESRDAPRWLWVDDFPREYQGMLIADALADLAIRVGKDLSYAGSGDRAQANSYIVQGETESLSAEEALRIIADTNDLKVTVVGETITVSFNKR